MTMKADKERENKKFFREELRAAAAWLRFQVIIMRGFILFIQNISILFNRQNLL